MQTVTELAPAKVNLTLDVLCRREDGYHNIRSVMQTISLCDDVTLFVDTGKPWTLFCTTETIPQDDRNLAWKAAKAFFDRTGIDCGGLNIEITKRIPSEAGLGGGSADAAAVLRGLNRFYEAPLSRSELCALGASVGADVPFLVCGGTAVCEGTGEILTPLASAMQMHLAVCKPDFPVSTPMLYRRIDEIVIDNRPDSAAMLAALKQGDVSAVAAAMGNVFEPLVRKDHPEIADICETMRACGALGAQMTGSGSAVFGIFAGEQAASAACARLKTDYPQTFAATTV